MKRLVLLAPFLLAACDAEMIDEGNPAGPRCDTSADCPVNQCLCGGTVTTAEGWCYNGHCPTPDEACVARGGDACQGVDGGDDGGSDGGLDGLLDGGFDGGGGSGVDGGGGGSGGECPPGYHLGEGGCIPDGGQCPEGYAWDGSTCVWIGGGGGAGGTGQCPQGYVWDGSTCVWTGGGGSGGSGAGGTGGGTCLTPAGSVSCSSACSAFTARCGVCPDESNPGLYECVYPESRYDTCLSDCEYGVHELQDGYYVSVYGCAQLAGASCSYDMGQCLLDNDC